MEKSETLISVMIDYNYLSNLVVEKLRTEIQPPQIVAERKKIKGIRGLANYIGSSVSKAQDIKNKGIIPYSEIGNRVFFWSDEIDSALTHSVR